MHLKNTSATRQSVKKNTHTTKQWDIQHLLCATIPGMDRWEILTPALICNVNQSNEKYITLIQGCISIKSQHPIR